MSKPTSERCKHPQASGLCRGSPCLGTAGSGCALASWCSKSEALAVSEGGKLRAGTGKDLR